MEGMKWSSKQYYHGIIEPHFVKFASFKSCLHLHLRWTNFQLTKSMAFLPSLTQMEEMLTIQLRTSQKLF